MKRASPPAAAFPAAAFVGLVSLWPGTAGAEAKAPAGGGAKTSSATTTPANATLHVTPGALGTPWTFEITNTDTTPLRVVADGRLLTLDVTPGDPDADDEDGKAVKPKSHATVHCALPADVRPTTDTEGVAVLEPDMTYVEEFDPRLYCFDSHDAEALAPGARVVAHLGWASPHTKNQTPPFIADEILGGDERAGVKELTADPVVTPDAYDPDPDDNPKRAALMVTTPVRLDAELARDLTVDVTVENTSSRTIHMMLRPETLAFEVASSKGVFRCGWRGYGAVPLAEVFTTIAPNAKASTSVQLASICPEGALQKAGLYTVRARIDTRRASGASIGIDTFDGVVDAGHPMLVRLRHSTSTLGPTTPIGWAKGSSSSGGSHAPPPPRPPIARRPGGHK